MRGITPAGDGSGSSDRGGCLLLFVLDRVLDDAYFVFPLDLVLSGMLAVIALRLRRAGRTAPPAGPRPPLR